MSKNCTAGTSFDHWTVSNLIIWQRFDMWDYFRCQMSPILHEWPDLTRPICPILQPPDNSPYRICPTGSKLVSVAGNMSDISHFGAIRRRKFGKLVEYLTFSSYFPYLTRRWTLNFFHREDEEDEEEDEEED